VSPKRKDPFCSSVLPEIVRNRLLLATDASVSECQCNLMNLVATGLWPVRVGAAFSHEANGPQGIATGPHFYVNRPRTKHPDG
jgi:hypothetical protein